MGENEDQKWRRLQRERDQNLPRNGASVVEAEPDNRLLHPANEGHDEERSRVRETKWAGQTVAGSAAPPVSTAPSPGVERGEVETGPGPEAKAHGSPFHADDHLRERQVRGGEAKKHPRAREETTPEPGPGPHRPEARAAGEVEIPPNARPIGADVTTEDRRDEYEPAGTRRRPRDL
ncbi:MAG: hypothetical protein Q8P41_31190 [Pseudomonadota bacterium]|nr:hypothetical protein [Pseudomonadota bacterium]